jgi:hypothetical protein
MGGVYVICCIWQAMRRRKPGAPIAKAPLILNMCNNQNVW